MSMNKWCGVGRITKDPELRKTQSGLSTVTFSLAVNRRVSKDQEQQADFINCVAWRQTADYMANYVKKGALLGVEGRIQTRNYDDKSGKRVYVTEVVCDSVQTLVRASETNAGNDYSNSQANTYTSSANAIENDFGSEELEIAADDLPF